MLTQPSLTGKSPAYRVAAARSLHERRDIRGDWHHGVASLAWATTAADKLFGPATDFVSFAG